MAFEYFSQNGVIKPLKEAQIALSHIEYQYGFGVYETIRVANGVVYFLADHLERLIESARLIGLAHVFDTASIEKSIAELLGQNRAQTCNIKILLIGAERAEDASLNILCLNPLFPDKKMYRDGVSTITYEYERAFPRAKTLNMLQSYLAYREAKASDCYDALLLDREGCITEGTRTNFFCMRGMTLYSPPEEKILLGVTRKYVLDGAQKSGFMVEEKEIPLEDVKEYEAAFLTATSIGIMPIRLIGEYAFPAQPEVLKKLMAAFDTYLGAR